MTRRLRLAALALVPLAVAGCSSSTPKKAASSLPAKASGQSVAPATVTATLRKGIAATKTAHVQVIIDAAGQHIAVAADETLHSGTVAALRATSDSLPAITGAVTIVQIGGRRYATLPNTTGKPYVAITKTTDATQAAAVDLAVGAVSLDQLVALADAAKSARAIGPATVGGVPATRYSVVVVTSKLPASFPGQSLLTTVGLTQVPVDVYLDSSGRPLQVSQSVSLQGQRASLDYRVSRYNAPVSISAPPTG